MNTQIVIPLVAVIAVWIIVALVIWFASRRFGSLRLRRKYGPEYDYTVEKLGDRRTAEADLKEREKRVTKLDIHELNDHEKDRYHNEWTEIQAGFVDDPARSAENANRLITEVMIARGFPVADFEQRAADLSVLYPNFAPKYRQANSIIVKNQNGDTSTEELRQALVDYHSLFDQLIGTSHRVQPKPDQQKPEKKQEKQDKQEKQMETA